MKKHEDIHSLDIINNYFEIRCKLFHNKITEISYTNSLNIPQYTYLSEMCKLNLDFGRQTGSTFFHHYLLNYLTTKNLNSLSIFHNKSLINIFYGSHKPINHKRSNLRIDNHILKIFPKTNILDNIIDYNVDILLIDVSALYKTHQIKSIIKSSLPLNPKMVILL